MKLLGPDATSGTDAVNFNTLSGAPSWAGKSRTGRFDKVRSVYNWKGSNTRKIQRGLALAAKGGRTDHMVIGDSATAGCLSSIGTVLFDRVNSWPYSMRNALAGMGVPIGGTGLMRIVDSTSFSDTQRYAVTGSWSNAYSSISTTSNGATIVCTPDVGGSIIEVQYYQWVSGGTFTVSVDGVVLRTVSTANATSKWVKIRVPNVSITANTTKITLTVTAAGSGTYFRGINVFTPASGLIIHNVAQSGSTASGSGGGSWTDVTTVGIGTNMYSAYGSPRTLSDGVFTASSTTVTSATAAFTQDDIGSTIDVTAMPAAGIVIPEGTYIAGYNSATSVTISTPAYVSATAQQITIEREPSCVHIELMFNDLSQGATVSDFKTAIRTIRSWYSFSDVILHVPQEGAYTVNAYTTQANQDAFALAMYDLADEFDCPLFDWRDRIGRFAEGTSNGVYGDPQVHLTASTYASVGAFLAEVIGEKPGKTQSWVTPTAPFDVVPKFWVDRAYKAMPAPTGYWQPPCNMMGTGTATAPTSGLLSFVPFDVGPTATTYSNIGVGVGTAQVAGTTTTTLGIYYDDGTGGAPATVRGPIFSGTITLTATGNRSVSLSNLVLQPGRYWLAFLYVASVAPTTNPTVYTIANSLSLPLPNSSTIGTAVARGWFKSSQTTLPAIGTDLRSTLSIAVGTQASIVALQGT